MSIYDRIPKFIWRLMKLPRIFYRLGLHRVMGDIVLLLTTTGRKTGLKRVTPLQYVEIDGAYYIGSARGKNADWYRNILANPDVEVMLKSQQFDARAEPIEDPSRIADILQVRLKQHPIMVKNFLRSQGLPKNPTREQLERFSQKSAMVEIRPIEKETTASI